MTPWFHGWNVLAVGILTVAMMMGTVNYSFTFYVVEWVEEFGTSRGFTMLALSMAAVLAGFLYPFSGRAMDRFPIAWLAGAGITLLSLAFVLIAFATSMWHVMAVYAVFIAIAESFTGLMMAQTLAAKWFRARRGLAIGLAALGTSVGGFLMPPLVAYLIVQHGWRSAHLYIAAIVFLVAVPLLLTVVRGKPRPEGDGKLVEDHPQPQPEERNWSTREILTNRYFWLIVLAFLPVMEMSTALLSNLALWTSDLGIDTQKTAFLMSLLSLMMITGKVSFGYLADRVEIRWLFFLGVGLISLALVLMTGTPGYPMLLLIIVLMGLAVGGQMPLAGALIGRHFGALAFGSVMGLFYLCIRPVAFGGPIGGWIRDFFGSYDYFWLAGLAVILLFAPAMYWIKPLAQQRESMQRTA